MGSLFSKSQSSLPSPPRPASPLSVPWRYVGRVRGSMQWSEEMEKALHEKCLRDELGLGRTQRVRILMLGATGSGKSSFVNSLYNALKDDVNQWTFAAASHTTVTKTLYSPRLRIRGRSPWFKLLDAPGILETDEAFYTDFVTMVLDGHIKEDVEIPPGRIRRGGSHYVPNPGKLDRPCLVVFVVKAGGYIPDSVLKRKFEIVKKREKHHKVKIAVVLTKADILSQGERYPLKGRDVQYTYRSRAAQQAVEIAHQETGVPKYRIFPVTNYTEQTETCTEMNVLHLHTLTGLLELARHEAQRRLWWE